jgi:hypothetical protein
MPIPPRDGQRPERKSEHVMAVNMEIYDLVTVGVFQCADSN